MGIDKQTADGLTLFEFGKCIMEFGGVRAALFFVLMIQGRGDADSLHRACDRWEFFCGADREIAFLGWLSEHHRAFDRVSNFIDDPVRALEIIANGREFTI